MSFFGSLFNKLARIRQGGQVAWVTLGNVSRTLAVFLSWAILARVLPQRDFGVFVLAYSVMTLLAQLTESGLGVSVVKFVSQESNDWQRMVNLIKASFTARAVLTLAAAGVLIAFAKPLATIWLSDPAFRLTLVIVAVGAVCSSYQSFILSLYQGFKRFKAYGLLNVANGVALLLGLGGLSVFSILSIESALVAVAISFLIPAICGHFAVGVPLVGQAKGINFANDVLSFSRWTAVSGLIAMAIMQADVLIVHQCAALEEVGLYSVGQRLALSVSVLSTSLLTVALPHVMQVSDVQVMQGYWRRAVKLAALSPIIWPFAFVVGPVIIGWMFGARYLEAALPFGFLFVAFSVSFVTNAMGFISLSFSKPQITATSLAVQLISLIVIGVPLSSSWGAAGMAFAVVLSRCLGLLLTAVLTRRLLWRQDEIHAT